MLAHRSGASFYSHKKCSMHNFSTASLKCSVLLTPFVYMDYARDAWRVQENVVRTAKRGTTGNRNSLCFCWSIHRCGICHRAESMQYFVAFGLDGIWGGLLTVASLTFAGLVMLALGSYFRAGEHSAVFTKITHPAVARFLDVAIMVTLFATGMVMIAGAGSNLEQQFGWPTWAGSVLMVILVCLTGLLDVDRKPPLSSVPPPRSLLSASWLPASTRSSMLPELLRSLNHRLNWLRRHCRTGGLPASTTWASASWWVSPWRSSWEEPTIR